jgi:chromosome segregation protein
VRIRSLSIHGFKSFADRTVITFGSGISCVVGSNGCGKSNVFDAVKWCVGEQSAKRLRGETMEDVIFAGSLTRAPVGYAEVVVTFEGDTESPLPGEWADKPEMSVGRRLNREGASDYLINSKRVRRKEVIDLFRDTGVGTSSYSFIEQGRVEEIIHAKPEQRRTIFDEAAGISKYKARRKEAMSRLEATATQLDRAADVSDEMGSRLAKLERQVLKAAQFRRLRELVRQEEIFLALARYADQSAERSAVRKLRKGAQRAADTAVSEVARKEHDLVTRREEMDSVRAVVQQWRDEVAELDGQRREEAAALGFLRRKVDETREELARIDVESASLQEAFTATRTALGMTQESADDLEKLEAQVVGLRDAADKAQAAVARQQEEMLDVQRRLGVAESRSASLVGELERIRDALNREEQALCVLTSPHQGKTAVASTKLTLLETRVDDLIASRTRLRAEMTQVVTREGDETVRQQAQLEARRAAEALRYEARVEQERKRLTQALSVTIEALESSFESWENTAHDEMKHFEGEATSEMEQSLAALTSELTAAQQSGEALISDERRRVDVGLVAENLTIDEQVAKRTAAADELFRKQMDIHDAAEKSLTVANKQLGQIRQTLAEKLGALVGQEQQLASTFSEVDPDIASILGDTRCLLERIPSGSLTETEVTRLGHRALMPVVTSLETLLRLQELGQSARLLWLPCDDDAGLVDGAQRLSRVGGISTTLVDAVAAQHGGGGGWVTPHGSIGLDSVLSLGDDVAAVTVVTLQGSVRLLTKEVAKLRKDALPAQGSVETASSTLMGAVQVLEQGRVARREEERALQTWSFEARGRTQAAADRAINAVRQQVQIRCGEAATALEQAQASAYDALQQAISNRQKQLSRTREEWRKRLITSRDEENIALEKNMAEVQQDARREWDDVLSQLASTELAASNRRAEQRAAHTSAGQDLEREIDTARDSVGELAGKVALMRGHAQGIAEKCAQIEILLAEQQATSALLDETTAARSFVENASETANKSRTAVSNTLQGMEKLVAHVHANRVLVARSEVAQKNLQSQDEERVSREARVASLDIRYDEAYARLLKDRARSSALDLACRKAETDLRETLSTREEAVSQFDKLTSRFEVLRTEVERLREDIQDRHDLSLSGTLDRLDMLGAARLEPSSATEPTVVGDKTVAGVEALVISREEIADVDRVKAMLSQNTEHRAALDRIGEVNLLALDEYQDVAVRHADLLVQRHDLEDAVTRIRAAIAKMNRTCRQMFREAFDDIQDHFCEIYPRLVGGGSARLALTNEEDLLETGVEIYVQPPGKRSQNLTLLSGGEKAMAAISLLMSMFKVRPSPFCLMDEVDAPLDEANGSRFNEMLKEMSTVSQFILITHNRKTMESADTLYGVTMVEPGTSRVVSVQLSETV